MPGRRNKPKKPQGEDASTAARTNSVGQNQRGWAKGVRAEIMGRHVDSYAKARTTGGWLAERKAWMDCCREYNFIIDWRTPNDQEVVGPLRQYDPDLASSVDAETLSSEDTVKKAAVLKARNDVSNEFQSRLR